MYRSGDGYRSGSSVYDAYQSGDAYRSGGVFSSGDSSGLGTLSVTSVIGGDAAASVFNSVTVTTPYASLPPESQWLGSGFDTLDVNDIFYWQNPVGRSFTFDGQGVIQEYHPTGSYDLSVYFTDVSIPQDSAVVTLTVDIVNEIVLGDLPVTSDISGDGVTPSEGVGTLNATSQISGDSAIAAARNNNIFLGSAPRISPMSSQGGYIHAPPPAAIATAGTVRVDFYDVYFDLDNVSSPYVVTLFYIGDVIEIQISAGFKEVPTYGWIRAIAETTGGLALTTFNDNDLSPIFTGRKIKSDKLSFEFVPGQSVKLLHNDVEIAQSSSATPAGAFVSPESDDQALGYGLMIGSSHQTNAITGTIMRLMEGMQIGDVELILDGQVERSYSIPIDGTIVVDTENSVDGELRNAEPSGNFSAYSPVEISATSSISGISNILDPLDGAGSLIATSQLSGDALDSPYGFGSIQASADISGDSIVFAEFEAGGDIIATANIGGDAISINGSGVIQSIVNIAGDSDILNPLEGDGFLQVTPIVTGDSFVAITTNDLIYPSHRPTFVRDPHIAGEVKWYYLCWENEASDISSSSWELPDNFTQVSTIENVKAFYEGAFRDKVTAILLSTTEESGDHIIEGTITTTDGETLKHPFIIKVRDFN